MLPQSAIAGPQPRKSGDGCISNQTKKLYWTFCYGKNPQEGKDENESVLDRETERWMDGKMTGQMVGWMDGQADFGWTDGWMMMEGLMDE